MVLYVSYPEIGPVKVSNLKPADGSEFDGPFKNKWGLIRHLNEKGIPNSRRPRRYMEHTKADGFFKKR